MGSGREFCNQKLLAKKPVEKLSAEFTQQLGLSVGPDLVCLLGEAAL
jgi:hypothetical protein